MPKRTRDDGTTDTDVDVRNRQTIEYLRLPDVVKEVLSIAVTGQMVLQRPGLYKYLSLARRAQPDMREILKQHTELLELAPSAIYDDREFVLFLLKMDGSLMSYMPSSVRCVEECREASVPDGFPYWMESDKDNEENVLKVLQQNGCMLNYVNPKLQNDPKFVEVAIDNDPGALQYASAELRANKEIARHWIHSSQNDRLGTDHWDAFKYLSSDIREDPSISDIAIRNCGWNLMYVSDSYKTQHVLLETFYAAINSNPQALEHVKGLFNDDEDIVRCIILDKKAILSLPYVSQRILHNEVFAFDVIKSLTKENSLFAQHVPLYHFPSSIRSNKRLVEASVAICPESFVYATDKLKFDVEFVDEMKTKYSGKIFALKS